jgi:hypothetical protein
MADSDTSFAREASIFNTDKAKLQTKRLPHAFSIEKLLSVTSAACEDSLELVTVGRTGDSQEAAAHNPEHRVTEEDNNTLQYRHCSYGRTSMITSIVRADSSSVGLRPGCCSDCEEDQEASLEDEMDELTVQSSPGVVECGAVVSTTLTDVDGSNQGPHSGEFHFLYAYSQKMSKSSNILKKKSNK